MVVNDNTPLMHETDSLTPGTDNNGDKRRQFQCFLFLKDPNNWSKDDSNRYARPLPTSPVVGIHTNTITRVDWLPRGPDVKLGSSQYKVPPPNEYMPKYHKIPEDLKPLNVMQPAGASFTVEEDFAGIHLIKWQKWRFRLGFNGREGMVLYDVGHGSSVSRIFLRAYLGSL